MIFWMEESSLMRFLVVSFKLTGVILLSLRATSLILIPAGSLISDKGKEGEITILNGLSSCKTVVFRNRPSHWKKAQTSIIDHQ